MTKNRCSKFVVFVAVGLSTCFSGSCATEFRDAVKTGLLDFTSGTVADTLGSFVSASTLTGGAAADQ
ncbi:MAG: hypothetical protein ACE5E5_04555 [Phycisphaerae bacterium]